jgi:hypothetical protein
MSESLCHVVANAMIRTLQINGMTAETAAPYVIRAIVEAGYTIADADEIQELREALRDTLDRFPHAADA